MTTPQRQSDPAASYGSRPGASSSFSGGVQSPPVHQTHASQPFNPGPPPSVQQHERSFSQGPSMQFNNGSSGGPPRGPSQGPSYSSGSISASGPPQLSTLPFQSSHTPPPAPLQYAGQQGGGFSNSGYAQSPTSAVGPSLPPLKPVFGLSLEQLFERDGAAVPMVVYQCIQAVDLFGLEVEGIYRLSGTSSHITKIKAMFDNGMLS